MCRYPYVICVGLRLCYLQGLVCVMFSLEFVLCTVFSLHRLQSLVCVMCRLQSGAPSLLSEGKPAGPRPPKIHRVSKSDDLGFLSLNSYHLTC